LELFLRKVIKIDATRCLDFSSKFTKMRLAAGDPLAELTSLLRSLIYLYSKGPTTKGRGNAPKFVSRFRAERSPWPLPDGR